MNLNLDKFVVAVAAEGLQARDKKLEDNLAMIVLSLQFWRARKNHDRISWEMCKIQVEFDKYELDFGRVMQASLM